MAVSQKAKTASQKNKAPPMKASKAKSKPVKAVPKTLKAALDKKVARAWMAVSRFPPNWGPPPKPW